jgi:hypothetical protein
MRRLITALALVGALAGLVGCSGSSGSSGESDTAATTSVAPEEKRTTAAAVATGIKGIDTLAAKIGAASADAGKTLSEGIEPLWQPIEGTVKANDADTYLAFEDNFALLESGDVAKAQRGAAGVKAAAAAYLAKFSG